MEDRIAEIENELAEIKKRNARVEADKAWETSSFRVLSVCAITYAIATIAMFFIGVRNPGLNALVPTLGFFLSTQTLPMLKKWWVERRGNSVDGIDDGRL